MMSKNDSNGSGFAMKKDDLSLPHFEALSGVSNLNKFLFEQTTDAILISDFMGNLLDVNSSLCTMFGYTRAELLEKNVRELLDPVHLSLNPIKFERLIAGENLFTERKMIHKDSTIIYVEANSKRISDNRILVIARNINRLKLADSALEATESHLKTIFDNTDSIYVLLDCDLRIVSFNRGASRFADKELKRKIKTSRYLLDYFSYKRKLVLKGYMQDVLRGKKINYEVKYSQSNGSLTWYYVRLFPIKSPQKKITGLIMAVSDITVKKELELALEEARLKKQIEITDAVITAEENGRRQIGLELHDNVNQLLATARMYVGMAKHLIKNTEQNTLDEADQFIGTAIEEIRKLSHNLVAPFTEKFGLVDSLKFLADTTARSAGLLVSCDMQLDHVSIEQKLSVTIYRIAQEQLNNILKHAKARFISIKLLCVEKKVILSIQDDGVGFDISLKRTGIGLLNIRTRASLSRGEVFVNSKPGQGCELKVIFDL